MPFEDLDGEAAEVAAIRWAAEECLAGRAVALVTGPINKAKLVAKGFSFHGHTEFLFVWGCANSHGLCWGNLQGVLGDDPSSFDGCGGQSEHSRLD